MAKVKRYVNDGYVTSEDSNFGMKEARDAIDADIAKTSMMTRSYKPGSEAGMMEKEPAVNFESTPKTKAPIVTKEQLAKSGLTLREYMNKQQGLKSRGESKVTDTGDETARSPARKPSLKYQSLQDREIENQAKRRAAGRSFYGTKTMAGGGTASSRADGIAMKGKTRGKMC